MTKTQKSKLEKKITVYVRPLLKSKLTEFCEDASLNRDQFLDNLIKVEVPRLQSFIEQEASSFISPKSTFLTPEVRERIRLACIEGAKDESGKRNRAGTLDLKVSEQSYELLRAVCNGDPSHQGPGIQSNVVRDALFNCWLFYLVAIPNSFWTRSKTYRRGYEQATEIRRENWDINLVSFAQDPLGFIHDVIDRSEENSHPDDDSPERYGLYDYRQDLAYTFVKKRDQKRADAVLEGMFQEPEEEKQAKAERKKQYVSCLTCFAQEWQVGNTKAHALWEEDLLKEFIVDVEHVEVSFDE